MAKKCLNKTIWNDQINYEKMLDQDLKDQDIFYESADDTFFNVLNKLFNYYDVTIILD